MLRNTARARKSRKQLFVLQKNMLDKENSDNVCMVAMNAIYPFVYAFRRGGNLKNGPYQCTDCGETVKFTIETVE